MYEASLIVTFIKSLVIELSPPSDIYIYMGWNSSVVRLERRTRESMERSRVRIPANRSRGQEALCNACMSNLKNFRIQGRLSVLTLISVSVAAPCGARKRSRLFCQKCRWQVTAKHACTLRMWLCMEWYGVH